MTAWTKWNLCKFVMSSLPTFQAEMYLKIALKPDSEESWSPPLHVCERHLPVTLCGEKMLLLPGNRSDNATGVLI